MSALTALDAQFTDGNVPLGVMVGAIGALSTVRRLLPVATEPRGSERHSPEIDSVEAFLALLLGVIAMHDRLAGLVDRSDDATFDEASEREIVTAPSLTGLGR
jgi:hypothetical protein